jgi:hypothetical protein
MNHPPTVGRRLSLLRFTGLRNQKLRVIRGRSEEEHPMRMLARQLSVEVSDFIT